MEMTAERRERIASIDKVIRKITWQGQKQSLQTLSRPDIDLTMPQMVTLFAIRSAGTCRMSELAELTNQSAGTLTGIVDRLIDDGLVQRVRDTEDRRVVQVALTEAGEERLQRVEQARVDDMFWMLSRFSNEQLHHLEDLLNLLLEGIYEWHSNNLGERATLHANNASNGNGKHAVTHDEQPVLHNVPAMARANGNALNGISNSSNGNSNGNGSRIAHTPNARSSANRH